MIRLAVHGGGRMAERVARAAGRRGGVRLVYLAARRRPAWLAADVRCGPLSEYDGPVDLVVDFTLPGGTAVAAAWGAAHGAALVSGTTGLEQADEAALDAAAAHVPVLWAPNLARGVNETLALVEATARALPADTPVSVHDVHHVHKKDAPSGTALALARAVARGRGVNPDDVLELAGEASPAAPAAGRIRCSSRREGEVIGEHVVTFHLPAEAVSITHVAADRDIYAEGALDAGAWLLGRPAGRYGARDWLRG